MKALIAATVALGLSTGIAFASPQPVAPASDKQLVASSWSWFVIRPIFLPPSPCRCG